MKGLLLIGFIIFIGYSTESVHGLQCYDCKDCQKVASDTNVITCGTDIQFCYTATAGDGTTKKWSRGCLTEDIEKDKTLRYIFCGSDKCNIKDKALNCYSCSATPECIDQQHKWTSKTCEIDQIQCFERLMADGANVERGCVDHFECGPGDFNCFECGNSTCNSDLYVTCYNCDESKDPDCRTNARKFGTCATRDQCYTCIENGKIYRGCEAINRNACVPCKEKNCNDQIPTECFSCQSTNDPNCLRNGDKVGKEVCHTFNGQCITNVEAGATVRRCSREGETCANKTDCSICTGDGCNKEILDHDKMKCYECNTANRYCNDEPNVKDLKECPDQDKNPECYQYLNDNERMIRGCQLANSPVKACKDRGIHCYRINDIAANGLPMFTNFSCLSCDKSDPNCAFGQPKAKGGKQCNFYFYEQVSCYTNKIDANAITRGCSNDLDACDENDPKCIQCSNENCNDEDVAEQFCAQCDDSDRTCAISNQHPAVQCQGKMTYDNRGCYIKRTDSGVRRGCLSDLSKQDMNDCLKGENSCLGCRDNSCNEAAIPARQCYSCSSEKVANCIHLKTGKDATVEACKSPLDKCIVAKSGEFTVRGCSKDITYDHNKTFVTCDVDLCNTVTIDQAKCYTCSNSDKCDASQMNDNQQICKNETDSCFMYEQNDHMVRGCSSDEAYKNCTTKNKCRTSDVPLNNGIALRETYNCTECADTEPSCPWYQGTNSASKSCTFVYGDDSGCYTKFNGSKVSRGCLNDKDACTKPDNNCKICSTAKCNVEAVVHSSCIQCMSNNTATPTCSKTADGLTSAECNVINPVYEQRGCFIKNDGKLVTRGCEANLISTDLSECKKKGSKICTLCENDGCNNGKVPGSASFVKALSSISLGLIAFFITTLH